MYTAPGIAVTTVQGKEITAEREILEALEEAADILYPEDERDDDEEDGDIEDMLKKELEGMNEKQVQKSTRFRVCKREAPCGEFALSRHRLIAVCYIIVLEPLDPSKLVRFILEKSERTAKCSFRFAQRIVPFHAVGRASMEELKEIAHKVIPDGFKTDDGRGLKVSVHHSRSAADMQFGIQTHSRNSNALDRLELIKSVAEEVTRLNSAHSVDLKNPDRTIIVDTFRVSSPAATPLTAAFAGNECRAGLREIQEVQSCSCGR